MATAADRMRAHRERARRGLRRLTIDVSEDDLRAIAKRRYEGAVTSDLDQQAQAVGLFLTDAGQFATFAKIPSVSLLICCKGTGSSPYICKSLAKRPATSSKFSNTTALHPMTYAYICIL